MVTVHRMLSGLALLALVLLTSGAAEARSLRQRPPNVVVIMTDDQDVASMRVIPNVQRLIAAQGVTFVNSFVNLSLCCPSRATFLTGQYAHNHGVLSNALPAGGYQKLDHSHTLPVWLQRAGYATVHIGKYLNSYGLNMDQRTIPPGWSEWYGALDPSTYNYLDFSLNENGKIVHYGRNPTTYQTDVYTQKALDIIKRRAPSSQPFFLWVAYLAPHNIPGPVPAPRHAGRFKNEPLPTPPSFNEQDVSDKPAAIRKLPL